MFVSKLSVLSRAFEMKIASNFFHTRCSIGTCSAAIVNKVANKKHLGEISLGIVVLKNTYMYSFHMFYRYLWYKYSTHSIGVLCFICDVTGISVDNQCYCFGTVVVLSLNLKYFKLCGILVLYYVDKSCYTISFVVM